MFIDYRCYYSKSTLLFLYIIQPTATETQGSTFTTNNVLPSICHALFKY